MRVVAALGGNALLRRGEPLTAAVQRRNVANAPDGDQFRRVVALPRPRRILEIGVIELLTRAGVIVICAGGGGIPVTRDPYDRLIGVEVVIDKDRASALLARMLGADALLLLTDVDAVFAEWGAPRQRAIARAEPRAPRALPFAPGSMAPKVEAACDFVEAIAGRAGLDALATLEGRAGTIINGAARGNHLKPG